MYKISYKYTLITGEVVIIEGMVCNKAFIRDIVFDPDDTFNHILLSCEYLG